MKNFIAFFLGGASLALVLTVGMVWAQWTPPTSAPPATSELSTGGRRLRAVKVPTSTQ